MEANYNETAVCFVKMKLCYNESFFIVLYEGFRAYIWRCLPARQTQYLIDLTKHTFRFKFQHTLELKAIVPLEKIKQR